MPSQHAFVTPGRFGYVKVLIWTGLLALLFLGARPMGQEYQPDEMIISLRSEGFSQILGLLYGIVPLERLEGTKIWRVRVIGPSEELVSRLLRDGNVEFVEFNYLLSTPEAERESMAFVDEDRPPFIDGQSPPRYFTQPANSQVMIDEARGNSTGQNVTVAVIDTGISATHPALKGRVLDGWDFVNNAADPTDEPGGIGYGHGTFVSGIIALVAPDAQILPLRVLSPSGRGDVFKIAKAIRYAVAQGAGVINMSLGLLRRSWLLDLMIAYASENGAVVVASAGNHNSNVPQYPASSPASISVAAVTNNDIKAVFSNFNDRVSVSAPGVDVYSLFPEDRYASWSGTSFSAAFVSGEAALVRALYPQARPPEIQEIIEQSSDDIYKYDENRDFVGKLGAGRINCYKATYP